MIGSGLMVPAINRAMSQSSHQSSGDSKRWQMVAITSLVWKSQQAWCGTCTGRPSHTHIHTRAGITVSNCFVMAHPSFLHPSIFPCRTFVSFTVYFVNRHRSTASTGGNVRTNDDLSVATRGDIPRHINTISYRVCWTCRAYSGRYFHRAACGHHRYPTRSTHQSGNDHTADGEPSYFLYNRPTDHRSAGRESGGSNLRSSPPTRSHSSLDYHTSSARCRSD